MTGARVLRLPGAGMSSTLGGGRRWRRPDWPDSACPHQLGADHHRRAIVLINVERPKVNATAGFLAGMRQISEVHSVSGHHALIAIVRVERNDDLAEPVTNHRLKIRGIEKTKTLLAFKAYSRHALEARFSV